MEPDLDLPRISVKMRWVLLPVMFLWWCFQLFAFSFFGGIFCLMIGSAGPFIELGKRPKDRDWEDAFFLLTAPFVCPVIWWIRYWKFGEYNTLE